MVSVSNSWLRMCGLGLSCGGWTLFSMIGLMICFSSSLYISYIPFLESWSSVPLLFFTSAGL